MEFSDFRILVDQRLERVTTQMLPLFLTSVSKDDIWNTYLESFPPGTNEIFRERREFDCNCCKNYVRNMGRLVYIEDDVVNSLWPETDDARFGPVSSALDQLVTSSDIQCVYQTNLRRFGSSPTPDNEAAITWWHFNAEVPTWCRSNNANDEMENSRYDFRMLKQLLDIPIEVYAEIWEKAHANTVYRLEERIPLLQEILEQKEQYNAVMDADKTAWLWMKSALLNRGFCRTIGQSFGVLIKAIADADTPDDEAYAQYERVMDPARYQRLEAKRASEAQIAQAQAFLSENGYLGSLNRRHANLDDLRPGVNAIFVDADVQGGERTADIFDQLRGKVTVDPSKIDPHIEMNMDEFVTEIVPTASSLEVLLTSRHLNNFVSLVAPADPDAKSIMKWDNGFSHVYEGGYADAIDRRVKSAGGNIDGEMHFSIMWNDQDYEQVDLDAHVETPRGHIYYGNKSDGHGELDVDMQMKDCHHGEPVVENIAWNYGDVPNGTYKFYVNNFTGRSKNGFRSKFKIRGQEFAYDHPRSLREDEVVQVLEVVVRSNSFEIKHRLAPVSQGGAAYELVEKWGLSTNQFHPVSALMLSPNYWGDNAIGNKHYILTLKGCEHQGTFKGFLNEFLASDLRPHRRVMDNMTELINVDYDIDQLSGLGFSTSKEQQIVVKVDGKQLMKVNVK